MTETKNCKECGKEFEPTRQYQIFCRKDCCSKWHTRNNRKLKIPEKKVCLNCQKEYFARRYDQKFCSRKCYQEYIDAQRGIERGKRECLWCRSKKVYMINQKFCSEKCRCNFYSVRKRIYSAYPFNHKKTMKELNKLEKLGKNYR